jgi:cell division protein FtsL
MAKSSKSDKSGHANLNLGKKFKEVIFSSRGFPLFLSFTTLAILFVLFRMKNVEMDYKITKSNHDIEKVLLDNKELKAKNARMLSTERLRRLAVAHHLDQPKQDQIIVIP